MISSYSLALKIYRYCFQKQGFISAHYSLLLRCLPWPIFKPKYSKTEKIFFFKDIANQESKLNKLASVAESIGNGDLNTKIDDLSNDDDLSSAILNMRDKLQSTKEKDLNENWMNEGRFRITEVIRNHNDLEALSNEVIKSIS